MKRLILIIGIAALLVGVGLGKCANAEDTSVTIGSGSITTDIPASYTGTGHYDEANCAICGKAQITELLKPIADKWLQDRIKENEQRRLENAERERIKRLKELQGKQQDLQRQIDELKQ